MLALNICWRICVIMLVICAFSLSIINAQTTKDDNQCDAVYDKLSGQQREALAALGPIALRTTWSFKMFREALGAGDMQPSSTSNEVKVGWYHGPYASRSGVSSCKEFKDTLLLGRNPAIYASFVSSGPIADGQSPHYLSVSRPFLGTVDGLGLGLQVSAFRETATKLGWVPSGNRSYRNGSWELSWVEDVDKIVGITFIDRSYTRLLR